MIRTSVENSRLVVTLDRAEKRNALSVAMLADIRTAFERHAEHPDLRVAVLRGAGEQHFAAGGDLRELGRVRSAAETDEMLAHCAGALDAIRFFPLPVVAALNGDALGGGAELALACDFRVASAKARVGFIQGRLNVTTSWGGGPDLMRRVGASTGLRLMAQACLTEPDEALRIGLVDAKAGEDESLDAALERFLEPVERQAPQVLRAFKALAIAERRGQTLEECRGLERRNARETWIHPDHWKVADGMLR